MKRVNLLMLTDASGNPAGVSRTVAIRDTDREDYKTGTKPAWFDQLPAKPVHSDHQNALFYDWHMGKVAPGRGVQ